MADEGETILVPGNYKPAPDTIARMAQSEGGAGTAIETAHSHGGINVSKLTLRLTLEGRRREQIQIVDIRPTALRRSEPSDGTFFDLPPQGFNPSLEMGMDLDQLTPVARLIDSEGRMRQPFFESGAISLKDREQDEVIIRLTTSRYNVSFKLAITYKIGGDERSVVIDDQGRPFRLTAVRCDRATRKASYQRAFVLGNDFSVVEAANPRALFDC
jgi:hypothetical protein